MPERSRDLDFASSTVGERAFVGRLYRDYGPRLQAALERRIDPAMQARIDAEDLVQETFLRAMRKWSGQSEFPPFTLVYRLGLDLLAEACRHHRRKRRDIRRDGPIPERSSARFAARMIESASGPATRAERRERQEQIIGLIKGMSESDREVLFMRHLDGLSSGEVAEVLGVEPRTVYKRYARAMQRLQKLCSPQQDEP